MRALAAFVLLLILQLALWAAGIGFVVWVGLSFARLFGANI